MTRIFNKKTVWAAFAVVVAILAYHAPKIAGAIPFQ